MIMFADIIIAVFFLFLFFQSCCVKHKQEILWFDSNENAIWLSVRKIKPKAFFCAQATDLGCGGVRTGHGR
jgi:hypothetical protein